MEHGSAMSCQNQDYIWYVSILCMCDELVMAAKTSTKLLVLLTRHPSSIHLYLLSDGFASNYSSVTAAEIATRGRIILANIERE